MQCVGGASGDMLLGALVDVGVPVEALEAALRPLPLPPFHLHAAQTQRGHVRATRVQVVLPAPPPHLPGRELLRAVAESALPPVVRERAAAVVRRLLLAEGRVHGASSQAVELHELGSPDTLIDVVGVVVGLELLGVQRLYASPLPLGPGGPPPPGGVYPRPGPVTLELIAMAGAPVAPSNGVEPVREMTTPTGAALLTTLAHFGRPVMTLDQVGYGAGAADPPEVPNVLGLWVGSLAAEARGGGLTLLEANLDDTTPEVLAYTQERLLELGALDVWLTPIQMTKGRPAATLSALVPQELEEAAVRLLLRETTTLGVRAFPAGRYQAAREAQTVATRLGSVRVKVKYLEGRPYAVAPEYEECARLARERGLPLQVVYRVVQRETEEHLLGGAPDGEAPAGGATAP